MDKVKIKKAVTDAEEIINELVSEGKLDGDQANKLIFDFTEQALRGAYQEDLEVA